MTSVWFWTRIAIVIQASFVLFFSFSVSPDEIESGDVSISTPCRYYAATGEPCATCGVTRGIAAMGSLEWIRAWDYNPLSVLIFVGEFILLFLILSRWFRSRKTIRGSRESHNSEAVTG